MNRLTLLLLALCITVSAGAQETYNSSGRPQNRSSQQRKKPKGFDRERLVIGGAPVLGFGSGSLAIGLAPIVGYRFTDGFVAGIGLSYIYYKQNDALSYINTNYNIKAHAYSASVWARYLVFENIFAHVEYEHNFINYTNLRFDPNGSGNVETYWAKQNSPSLLVGGGYRSPISSNASFVAMLLYDVLQDKRSPYLGAPSIRFGVNIGF